MGAVKALREIPAIIEIVFYEPERRQDSSPEFFVLELKREEAQFVLDRAAEESKVYRLAGMLERVTIYIFDNDPSERCYRWTSKSWKRKT